MSVGLASQSRFIQPGQTGLQGPQQFRGRAGRGQNQPQPGGPGNAGFGSAGRGGFRSRSNAPRSTATYQTNSVRDQSSLSLKLTTAEGDTVELSVAARSLSQTEQGTAQGPNGAIATQSSTQQNQLKVSVKVKGDLSDQEVADIQSLLDKLTSGDSQQTQGAQNNAESNAPADAATQNTTAPNAAPQNTNDASPTSSISSYSFAYSHQHQETSSSVTVFA